MVQGRPNDGAARDHRRGLLRRPRLRRGARRRDALDHARLRQGIALVLFLPFDGLVSLYIVSAMFGLFQGGIVPSYAIIVREYFPPREAGVRTGVVLMATLFGMAFGGWVSGAIFDVTGSYRTAFINGIAWNFINLSIAGWLLKRAMGSATPSLGTR
jgi:MFS family permease